MQSKRSFNECITTEYYIRVSFLFGLVNTLFNCAMTSLLEKHNRKERANPYKFSGWIFIFFYYYKTCVEVVTDSMTS